MERTLMSFDYAMKDVLRNKANFDILSGLLSELLKKDVVVQEILESECNTAGEFGKLSRLDLKAKIDGGEIAIFEVQANTQGDFFHRILFGTSKTIVEQMSKSDEYGKIKKVYSIDIVYFELGKGSDYIYHGLTEFKGLHNKDEMLLLSDKEMEYLPKHKQEKPNIGAGEIFPEYYLIYPNRFDENIKDRFDEWVYLLKTSKVKSDFLAKGIKAAGEALAVEKMSEADRIDYENFLKNSRVRESEINTAKREGKAEGKIEGERAANLKTAKEMKLDGMPFEKIVKFTGLSIEEIEAL